MNSDETRELFTKLEALATGQASLSATVAHGMVQHGAEIKILFNKLEQQDVRLRTVETTYVTDGDHKADMERNRGDHHAFRDALEEQRTFSGKVWGAAIVVGVLLSALVTWGLGKL